MDKIVETALVNALRYGVFTRRQCEAPADERLHHVDAKRHETGGPVRPQLRRRT